ncbi:Gfo/Idh/MocA family protein [Pedobacter sp. ASV28]|uniref:Gfo/Idh/MocA family protein n=1 Tax=Pedobacter sp. ASV28 TaxID=2795123 RepID=UPI0018ED14D9|nr:Gfo/Idh/MocA family oxidoreductase [Pedobacter sp. ASV28]
MKQNTLPINFAVIGYGHIGKKHADILNNYPESNLAAIVDPNTDQLLPDDSVIPFFSALDDLLDSNIEFDVAVIATPNGLHAEHAIKCLNRGKHVVIEKPVALSTSDAEKIFEIARLNKREVFSVFQNRYAPVSIWLKDILAKQKLGKIFMVQLNCFWNRDDRYYSAGSWHGSKEMDGGTLFTQFSHYIDALYWFFGEINEIKSEFFNFNHHTTTEFEDSGIVTFNLENGGKGSFHFTTAVYDKNLESNITVIAESGTIKIGGQYMDSLLEMHAEGLMKPEVKDYITTNHQNFLYDVILRLQQGKKSAVSQQEVLMVIDIIERMYQPVALSKV